MAWMPFFVVYRYRRITSAIMPLILLCPHRSPVRLYVTTCALLASRFNENRNRTSFSRGNVVQSSSRCSLCVVSWNDPIDTYKRIGGKRNIKYKENTSTIVKAFTDIRRKWLTHRKCKMRVTLALAVILLVCISVSNAWIYLIFILDKLIVTSECTFPLFVSHRSWENVIRHFYLVKDLFNRLKIIKYVNKKYKSQK